MWLAVDSGNSRIKWSLVDAGRLLAVNSAAAGNCPRALQQAARQALAVWVTHVGGASERKKLTAALSACPQVRFVSSAARAAGVINRYQPPSSLGVDRWLGLVAMRPQRRNVIIASAGTAVTVDALRADGVFLGGVVLPGIGLMQQTVAAKTGLPRLPVGATTEQWPPLNTRAALCGGAPLAVAGAALGLRRRLLPGAKIIVTGGDAEQLLPQLPAAAVHVPQLPLLGLIRLWELRL